MDGDTESKIQRARGRGKPLGDDVRRSMEQGFGADFGSVKVHDGPESHELNSRVQASAFTTGSDIFFGRGAYNPSTIQGQELLAHELTHVVQQGGADQARVQRSVDGGPSRSSAAGTVPAAGRIQRGRDVIQRRVAGGQKDQTVVHPESDRRFTIVEVREDEFGDKLYLLEPVGGDASSQFLVYGDVRTFELVNGPPPPPPPPGAPPAPGVVGQTGVPAPPGTASHVPAPPGQAHGGAPANGPPPPPPPGAPPAPGVVGQTGVPAPPGTAGHVPAPPGQAHGGAAAPRASVSAPVDWSKEVAAINMRNCSWATLAAVLERGEDELTAQWQARYGAKDPELKLRTERAWAEAMVGFDRLQAAALTNPGNFMGALGALSRRLEKDHAVDVAQSYGVQMMVLDAIEQAGGETRSAAAAADEKSETDGPTGSSSASPPADSSLNRAYRLGDSGTDQFVPPSELIAAMKGFPDGTRFVVFLHGKGAHSEGGHYVQGTRTPDGVHLFDNQFVSGTTSPRGKMETSGDWPVVHKDFSYDRWVDGALIAIAPEPMAAPSPAFIAVTAATVDAYRARYVEGKVPSPPGWLPGLQIGDDLLQHSFSQQGEGRVKVAELKGKIYDFVDGEWIVNVEPVVERERPPEPTKAASKLKLPQMFAHIGQGGNKVTKVEKEKVISVKASDLMRRDDIGKVTYTPPAWYGEIVNQVAVGIAADLDTKKGELEARGHRFKGPGGHEYQDGVVIAMASGLRRMLEALGMAKDREVKVPELGKTVLLLPKSDFAFLKSLGETVPMADVPDLVKQPDELRQKAIENFWSTTPREGKEDNAAVAELLEVHGYNPGYTVKGVVVLNMDMQRDLATSSPDDVKAFMHLIVHEFIHANSDGGGGAALDHHGHMNQVHEEGVTDLIARAITDAIGVARTAKPADDPVGAAVRRTVPEVAAMTFGANGGVRYQAEVDMVTARITSTDMLRDVVAKAYFGDNVADKQVLAEALQ